MADIAKQYIFIKSSITIRADAVVRIVDTHPIRQTIVAAREPRPHWLVVIVRGARCDRSSMMRGDLRKLRCKSWTGCENRLSWDCCSTATWCLAIAVGS